MKSKIGPSKVPGPKAGPNGSFPIGDRVHAKMAISGATRSYNAGNIGKSTEDSIKAQARAKLGKPSAGNRQAAAAPSKAGDYDPSMKKPGHHQY